MMKHELEINMGKNGLMTSIETIMNCFREDENAEHEYILTIMDLQEYGDEDDENTMTFNNFPDACKQLCVIWKALRIGYEIGRKEGGKKDE